MERDPFKRSLPVYHFVRYMPEIFFCTDPDKMYFEELARVVRHFKQTSEGLRKMSSVIEEIREEGKVEGFEEGTRAEKTATVLQLVKMGGFTPENIAEITRLRVDEVRAIMESKAS